MANINIKEHVFIMVQGKNGPERREVKQTSSEHKITDRIKNSFETAVRRKARFDKKTK